MRLLILCGLLASALAVAHVPEDGGVHELQVGLEGDGYHGGYSGHYPTPAPPPANWGCLNTSRAGDNYGYNVDGATFDISTGATGVWLQNLHVWVRSYSWRRKIKVYVTTDGGPQDPNVGNWANWTKIHEREYRNYRNGYTMIDLKASWNHYIPPNTQTGIYVTFVDRDYMRCYTGTTYQESLGSDALINLVAGNAIGFHWSSAHPKRFRGTVCYTADDAPPPPVDDVCTGDGYISPLPPYWQLLADAHGVNKTLLGFNTIHNVWCYNGTSTCVGWGEWNGACDYSVLACACPTRIRYGCGNEQMKTIKEMLDMGDSTHYRCPECADEPPADMVYWCDNGTRLTLGDNATVPATYVSPASQDLATWVACDCSEYFEGNPVTAIAYWWGLAAAFPALDPSKISFFDNVWYYDGQFTCVGRDQTFNAACDPTALVCAGAGGATYGFGGEQYAELAVASVAADARHPACPV